MANCMIDKKEFTYTNVVVMFKTIEKLSNFLKDTYVMDLESGYPVNLSKQRIAVVEYLKNCLARNETAEIFTSKDSLQSIF